MAVGANDARRLVRTESTYIANSAEMESYKECGITKYRFVATLDMRTSDICAALDGKEFDTTKAMPGENMPPLHPFCRSTTVAVIDDAVTDGLKRRAKDPETGKYYKIPQDMTYEDWLSEQKLKANSDALDFAKGGRLFENSDLKTRVYPVKGKHNIYTETYSADTKNTIDFIANAQNNGLLDGVSDVVISKKLPGIAAYDHEQNVIYVNEKITNPEYIKKELGSGYFVAENAEDILKHEIFHKKHWDYVLTTSEKKNIMSIKQGIEADLRKYVKEQLAMSPSYILENVGRNAHSHFKYDDNLNEVIAEVLLQNEKGIVKDEILLNLVRRCVE